MNSIIKMYVKICWLAVCLVGFAFQSSATHVVGGDLTYECLGNDQYSISLTFQRDCLNGDAAAPFDEPAVVKIFDAVTNNLLQTIEMPLIEVMNLDEIVTNNCKVLGDPVCVDQAYYQSTVTLPFRANGYIVSYRRCCRNFTLLNVVDPLDTGSTYWAMISPTAQTECNSQAVFNNWPTIYLCADEELVFDHSATDADGDSLVYKVCTPSSGGSMQFPLATAQYFPPFDETAFAAPFTLANMMGGVPLSIDSETGLMTATPDQVGQYLIGICVEEYRNGVKISETRRDFEYNVRECSKGPESIFVAAPSPNCTDLSIMLENSSIVNISAPLTYEWIFDYPNGGVESTEETPDYTYAVGGLYTIALAVSDGECVDTSFQTIGVSLDSDPMVGFTVSNTDCADILVVTLEDNSTSTQDIVGYSWSVTKPDGSIETSTDATISFSMMNTGDVSVSYTVTTISGCSNTIEETVNIVNNSFTLDIASISGCEGELLPIGDLVGYDVTFTPDGIISLDANGMYVALVGSNDVVVTYTADNGACQYSNEFTVASGVIENPFATEASICNGEAAFLGDVPAGYTVTGDGVNIENGGLYISSSTSGVYTYTVSSATGCEVTATTTITVEESPVVDLPSSISVCGGEIGKTSVNLPDGGSVVWTADGDVVITSDGALVSFTSGGMGGNIYVTVTSAGGCESTGQTAVTLNDTPDLDLVADLGLCVLESTTVTVEGSENSTYSWTSTGDLAILSGSDEGTVTIIMSGDMGGDLFVTCTSPDGCTAVGQTAVAAYDTPNETIVSPLYACEGEELVLPTYGDFNTIYTVLSGSGSVDGGVYTYPIVSTGSGITTISTTTLDVTINSEFCSQSGIVNILVTPDPVNPAASPLMQCEGETVTLNAGALEGYDYVWSSVPFYPFTNPFEASPSVSVDQNTVFHVTATSTNGSGCSFEADIEVMYNALVEATFVPAIDTLNLCPDQMVNLVVETSAPAEVWCYYNYFTVTGSGTTELVSVFTGSGTTTNNLYDFDFMVMSGSGSGYIEKVIISEAGCTSSLILPVNIYNADVVINDIGNGTGIGTITYCAGDSVELIASSDQTVVTAMWFDMNGNPVSTTNPYVFVPTMGGVYTVEATLANGCIATSMVTLIESDPMVGITSSTGGEFCEGEVITLTADVTPDNLVVTWVCTDGTTSTGNPLTITPAGEVTCTATVMEGVCEDSETITLTPALANVAITPENAVICPGDEVVLTASGDQECTYLWSTGATTSTITVSPAQTTEYAVTCTNAAGCEATGTAIVTVESAPSVTAAASPESIEEGGSSTLSVTNPDAACTYTWFDAAGNEIGTGASISVTPGSTMTYTVTCVTEAGCSSSANVTVTVTATPTPDDECTDAMVYIPNTFSPNGDNSNDRYILYSEDDVIQIEFLIYDRWGEQVYKGNNISDFWDGTYEGELLNPDVYGYCVRWTCPYDGSVEYLKTGNITLIR